MSGALWFPLAQVTALAQATCVATAHKASLVDEGATPYPALWWVKDSGTYLMSNADPMLEGGVLYGRAYSPGGLLLEPPADSDGTGWDDVWDRSRDICGGDDFCEPIAINGALLAQLRAARNARHNWVVLTTTDDDFTLTTT